MEDIALLTSRLGDLLARRGARGVPTLPLGRRRLVYLLGPEANALVFGHDDWFRFREAFASLEVVDGPTSVVLSDGEDHRRRRGLIRPAVAPRRIDSYVATMVESADEALAATRGGRPFDAYELLRGAIRTSTVRALFGSTLSQRADEIGDTLQPLLDLANGLPQSVAARRLLHTPSWQRAMAARQRIDELIHAEIERERRAGEPSGSPRSLLSVLVHGRPEPGAEHAGLTDEEVRDQAVTMMAAGYETTSAAMGWVVYLLGARPQWQQRARAEVHAVLGDRPPQPDDLPHLKVLRSVVHEALRLYPPAMISARYVVTGFDFRGRRVAPGDLVIYSPYVTHRDPEVYQRPGDFAPDRWESGRRPPNEFLPFGGGQHRCLGSGFATTELTVVLARLLARGRYSLTQPPTAARGYAAMRPHPGVGIVFTEH